MLVWQEVLVYGLVGYVLLHLIVDDVLVLLRRYYRKEEPSHLRPLVRPLVVYSDDIEGQSILQEEVPHHSGGSSSEGFDLNPNEQRTLIVIFYKICNVVLRCVEGYFRTFVICWNATLNSLTTMIVRYVDFLQYMVGQFTTDPIIVRSLCATAVACLALTCVLVWILNPLPGN